RFQSWRIEFPGASPTRRSCQRGFLLWMRHRHGKCWGWNSSVQRILSSRSRFNWLKLLSREIRARSVS
ncbi:hypothetical protein CH063_01750, partial [Colletotrichum higginsianum]